MLRVLRPILFSGEMKRRREYYSQHPGAGTVYITFTLPVSISLNFSTLLIKSTDGK